MGILLMVKFKFAIYLIDIFVLEIRTILSRIFFPSSLMCLRFQFSGNFKGYFYFILNLTKRKTIFYFSEITFFILIKG